MAGCCGGESTVHVEFDYLVVGGETCDRCGDSREAVRQAVTDARALLGGVRVELVERELDPSELSNSNRVLVNGRSAEEWLGGAVTESDCPSCSDLLGQPACCREIEVGGERMTSFTREAVLDAIIAAAGLAGAETASGRSTPAVGVTLVSGPGCG